MLGALKLLARAAATRVVELLPEACQSHNHGTGPTDCVRVYVFFSFFFLRFLRWEVMWDCFIHGAQERALIFWSLSLQSCYEAVPEISIRSGAEASL